jgi:hypothetical protein
MYVRPPVGKSASPGSTAELLPLTSDHWQQAVPKPAQSLAFDAEGNSRPDRFEGLCGSRIGGWR